MDTYNVASHRAPRVNAEKARCYRCHGKGNAPCPICNGSGQVMAGADSNGHPRFSVCDGCFGRRISRCPTCHGQLFI